MPVNNIKKHEHLFPVKYLHEENFHLMLFVFICCLGEQIITCRHQLYLRVHMCVYVCVQFQFG